jgi:hypothetical protein
MNPYDAPEPEPRGMSGTTKVLLAFGIGCGLLVVLCCGIFGLGGVWLASWAGNSVSEEPAKVREATEEIVKIKIPESLEPKAVFDLRVPFRGDRIMTWVSYEGASADNHLVLGQFGRPLANIEDFESHMKQSMRESGRDDREDLDISESETIDTRIHDQDAQFKIAKGKGRRSNKEFWEATGQFRGDGGQAILLLRLASDDFTKEQVLEIINSMN